VETGAWDVVVVRGAWVVVAILSEVWLEWVPVPGVLCGGGIECGVDAPVDGGCGTNPEMWPWAIGAEVVMGVGADRVIRHGCAAMNLVEIKSHADSTGSRAV
jgi:hypothetical protein